jgi:hypothetical protein
MRRTLSGDGAEMVWRAWRIPDRKIRSESFISSDCGEHLDSAMPGQSVDARTQVAR